MRWAAAIATEAHLEDAVAAAADELSAALDGARPDLIFAFVTDHHAGQFGRLPALIERHFAGAHLLGCTAGGAIGGGVEIEHEPAIALTAASLPGVRLTPFRAGDSPRRWAHEVPVTEGADATFVVLPCPLTSPVEELLEWMDARWPASAKVGGQASGGMTTLGPSGNTLFLDGDRVKGGAVGIALEGDLHCDTVVAQGCRPVGDPLIISRARGNVALELDGEPPLRALDRLCARLPPDQQALARHSLFLGIGLRPSGALGRGDFLIRNLIGIDPGSGAMAVAAPLATGQVVQFHLRDARTSAADLVEMLSQHDAAAPEGALLFSCVGRGQLMYGAANHDSRVFRRIIGDVPLGGFFCNGEIGPIHRRTFLHGYTSSFALFRRKLALA